MRRLLYWAVAQYAESPIPGFIRFIRKVYTQRRKPLLLSWERKHHLQAVAEDSSYGSDTTQFDVETIRNAKERMQPVITVTRGLQIGKTVILETDLITIGRDVNSDIALRGSLRM